MYKGGRERKKTAATNSFIINLVVAFLFEGKNRKKEKERVYFTAVDASFFSLFVSLSLSLSPQKVF